jgi:hypothetical protein
LRPDDKDGTASDIQSLKSATVDRFSQRA